MRPRSKSMLDLRKTRTSLMPHPKGVRWTADSRQPDLDRTSSRGPRQGVLGA